MSPITESPHIPQRLVLTILLLASTLAVMAGSAIAPVIELMRGDLGVDGTAAGLILTAHGLIIALVSPLVGWIIDRIGVRWPLACGLLLYGLAGGAGIVIDTYSALIASRFLFGMGAAFVFTGTTVSMIALYRGEIRDRVMGWRTTATSLGGVLFPIVGGGLATVFSWHATFSLYAVGIPLGLAVLFWVKDPVRSAATPTASGSIFKMLGQPSLLGIFSLVIIQAIMLYALAIFLPIHLSELGLNVPVIVSGYMAVMAATSSLVGMTYGSLSRRFSYGALLRLTALCWIVAFLLLGGFRNFYVLAVGSAILGVANGLAFSTTTVLIDEYIDGPLLGRAMAVFSTCMFLGQFISPLLLGPIMQATSIATGYLILSALSVCILAVLIFSTRNRAP